jgi:hypothetical protein
VQNPSNIKKFLYKNAKNNGCCQGSVGQGTIIYYTVPGNINPCSLYFNKYEISQRTKYITAI